MHNWYENKRVKIKTFINGGDKTISNIFLSANWMERDLRFYGVDFIGHPQLKRILNMDEMISFPMRKEFPLKMADEPIKTTVFGRTIDNC
jgi:NADH-quinone oxidoreductase subunit C